MLKIEQKLVHGYPVWRVSTWEDITHGFLGSSFNFPEDRPQWESTFNRELALLKQTHSTDIVTYPMGTEGDAWLLDSQARACVGILTADCIPVLIRSQNMLAAAHLGWRGTVSDLLPKLLGSLNSDPSKIELAIGPGAQACCYEIGEDILDLINTNAEKYIDEQSRYLKIGVHSKYLLDLGELIKAQALSLGVHPENIANSKLCTICSGSFYSYRRQGKQAGRQLSYIGLTIENSGVLL